MRFWNRWGGLRTKIIAWSFVPTAIILTLVALVGFYAYQQVTQDLTIQSSREVARLSAGQLAAELSGFSNTLTALARTSAIYENNLADQRAALAQASNRLVVFDGGVLILDNYGTVVAAQPARPEILGQDWSSRDYFRQMIRVPGTIYSNSVNDGPGGAPVIVGAVPISNGRGELVGLLAGMFRVGATSVSSFYGTIVRLRIGVNDSAYLVDHNGVVFYHTNNDWIGQNLSAQPVVQQVNSGKADALRTRDPGGREIVASFAPVPGTPWGLVTEQSWDVLLAPGQRYIQFLFLLLVLGLVAPAVVVTVGVRRITQPINRLIAATQQVADGNLGHTTTVQTNDEIEELSTQFNRMSAQLAASYAELKAREERFALVTQGTNDGIWDWDLKTDDVYFSPRWKSMLGYADDELANRLETWRGLLHPEDVEPVMTHLQDYLERRSRVYQIEIRMRHQDGSYRWISARGGALWDAQGKPYRMTGSHTDITERKQAEDSLRQSEKRFSQVFRASPIPISITALEDGRYVEVNDAWLRLFGYTREQVIGESSLGLNVWVDPDQRSKMIARLQATGSVRNFEHLVRCQSGEIRDVLVSAEVIELNNARYNLSLVFDITERKRAQQELERRVAERTHELATLNAVAAVSNRSLDLEEIFGDTLDKILQVMGMEFGAAYRIESSPEDSSGRPHLNLMVYRGFSEELARRVSDLPYRRNVFENVLEVAAAGTPIVWAVDATPSEIGLKQVLEQAGIQRVISVPLTAKGKLVGVINLATRDPRTLAAEEVALLAAIGQQIGIAVENARLYDQAEQSAALAERTRLARELHDSVTQSLYSVTMYAEAAQLLLTAGNHLTAAEHLRELRATAQEALGEMRLLIYDLRPLALEKRGLAEALQERLETVEARGGITPELRAEGAERLSLAVQQELYHIAREALNNVIKHAQAHRVRVQLVVSERSACLEIDDDGVGFDPISRRGGLGLAGMKERVQRIGGTLEIASSVGKGTVVRVQIPGGQRN